MKESVTKFDLEAAFKALDEIDIPKVTEGIRANRPALTEIFSKKTKLEALLEDYYDINDTNELTDAKDARDAEIAQAKLARIEKIVDLNAESPEDLLMSYVGKIIIQCPQCMTLFYKDQEDIVEDESDPTNVNVNEVCQHCGNETGYTLVGKVGEVTPEEAENYEAAESISTEEDPDEVDVQSTDEEQSDEESLEELEDLDLDLDLEIEDDEIENDKNESLGTTEGEILTEELLEGKNTEKDDNFEELIDSDEFKKPISDRTVRAMLKDLGESKKNLISEENCFNTDDPSIQGFDYRVTKTFEDEGYSGSNLIYTKDGNDLVEIEFWGIDEPVSVVNNLFAPNLFQTVYDSFEAFAADLVYKSPKAEGKVEDDDNLKEGAFDKLKDKLSGAIKKVTKDINSRSETADWVLNHALKDGAIVDLAANGEVEIESKNRKFTNYAVVGFSGKYSDGNPITISPFPEDNELVVGMEQPLVRSTYEEAEKAAKAWSLRQGNGPAFIYLANGAEDDNAAFLCSYFDGKLDTEKDMLNKYFESVKKDLEGAQISAEEDSKSYTDTNISELKPGMRVLDNSYSEKLKGTVVKCKINTKVKNAKTGKSPISVTIQLENGDVNTFTFDPDDVIKAKNELKAESLDTCIENLDEINEALLENAITELLIKSHEDVAGFRLTNCTYLNEQLSIEGNLFYTSGDVVKTVYNFTEAFIDESATNKIKLCGNNTSFNTEKFQLIGCRDTDTKTFLTESITYIK